MNITFSAVLYGAAALGARLMLLRFLMNFAAIFVTAAVVEKTVSAAEKERLLNQEE